MLAEVISSIYEDTMTPRAKAAWDRTNNPDERYKNKLAYVFFANDKQSFRYAKSCRTYLTLKRFYQEAVQKLDLSKYEAPFITFNGFVGRRKRTEQNLRWINAVSAEVDNVDADVATVHTICDTFELPYPSLIVKSPNGLQFHWLLERERAFSHKIKDYKFVSGAIKQVFARIGADAVGVQRFWRMPTPYNTLYEIEDRYTLSELTAWAAEYLGVKPISSYNAKTRVTGKPMVNGVLEDAAIKEILEGVPTGIRNYACYTLALLHASTTNMSDMEIKEFLQKTWNPRNEKPIPERELQRTVSSAIRGVRSGRIKGASEKWINYILEQKGSNKRFRYEKRTKYVSERTYTKRTELMDKILKHVTSSGGVIMTSQRGLAKELQACFKSVQLALGQLEQNGEVKLTTYKGRNGGTEIRVLSAPNDSRNVENTVPDKITPLQSSDPDQMVINTVAATPYRVTIVELAERSHMEYQPFVSTLLQLIRNGRIRMLEPARDGTARFTLGPP